MAEATELGAVDERGVRVWLRRPGAAYAAARLEVEGREPVEGSVALSEEGDWTGAIALALPEPAPGAPFACVVGERRLAGRLAPMPGARADFAFGFGSCHMPFMLRADGSVGVHAGAGIYPAMLDTLHGEDARFLLLVGDQIYADYLPQISVRGALDDSGPPPSAAELLAAYRRVYRGYFQQAGFRRLRESLPTYYIWDDHDIFNDWGSRLQESETDRRLFEAAGRAYCEYQQLRNPGGGIAPPPYNYSFRYGDAAFLVLDLRGARDFDDGRLLGARQWEDVRAYLAGEKLTGVQTLFVIASVPVAHVSRWFVKLFERLHERAADAVRDRWCSSAFVRSRDELLDELFAWQTAAPGRQVVLLSGDVHSAGAFTIRQRRGPGVIRQFTSSALTTPESLFQKLLTGIAARAPNLFERRYGFQRHLLVHANNFGVVRLTPLPTGGHRVEFVVHAWRSRRRRLRVAGRLVAVGSRQ